jgi:uncharacterized membrane protein
LIWNLPAVTVENFSVLDTAALIWFVVIVAAYEITTNHTRLFDRSIAAYVQHHRREWMLRMSERESRIVDGQLLGWLVNANAFFASTSVITVGGLAALLGYGDKARLIFETLPYASPTSPGLWEIKVIFLMVIMVYAFFKFAWAFRLSHYTVIMMGSTPAYNSPDADERRDHAIRASELLGLVGAHSNQGLRAFYYTIAGLLWFFHPVAFMVATTWIVAILARRDFWSHSRAILRGA